MPIPLLYATAFAALVTCLPGCSLFIHHSGTSVRDLDSRQIVHERFGPPDRVSVVNLIDPHSEKTCQFEVEHHHIHRKLDTAMAPGFLPPLVLLVEPLLMCDALYDAAKECIEGHNLAFVYDEQGNTIGSEHPRPFPESLGARADKHNVLNWEKAGTEGNRR